MEKKIRFIEDKIKTIESLCTDNCINKSTVIEPLKYAIENLIINYRELEIRASELNGLADVAIRDYIPKSKIKEQILKPMKEEHNKAITGFMKRDIPYCLEDGGIAQELGYFIGKIEELLEDK